MLYISDPPINWGKGGKKLKLKPWMRHLPRLRAARTDRKSVVVNLGRRRPVRGQVTGVDDDHLEIGGRAIHRPRIRGITYPSN